MQLWGTGHVIRPRILRMRTNLAMFSFPVYYICVEVYVMSVWFRARPWFQLPATPLSTDLKIESVRRGTHWQSGNEVEFNTVDFVARSTLLPATTWILMSHVMIESQVTSFR